MTTYTINHRSYGERASFASLEAAEACYRRLADAIQPEWADITFRVRGTDIIDQDNQLVGGVFEVRGTEIDLPTTTITSSINAIWFVTRAGVHSTLDDICFVCVGAEGLQNQFAGGLDAQEVIAMYTDAGEARARARQVLADRDAFVARMKEQGVCR